ncbi:ribonuclease III [Heliophilum fasciatum]|uniref:Ribonuclease 3 n=1 Tax=Heliophilum fasciatum TaxID=35700 RepID=A0A4R2RM01_9FIRM|nr:ribonuclease III [Heliophilum fasciatum]MCW2278422.1 ribonuclease-3 [Heliophilum fasciatum]TCP63679.1 RNAse III [Heliophilum fasciatum]
MERPSSSYKTSLLGLAKQTGMPTEQLALLQTALTHPSFAAENPREQWEHNQRLEFLGDAVLGLIVGEALYQRQPDWSEGELSRRRAAIVCEASLAPLARELGLGPLLRLGRGEENSGGRDKPSVLADALEAVIGALFLAGGLTLAQPFVLSIIPNDVFLLRQLDNGDHKTAFQEWAQRKGRIDIGYRILEESGPPHNRLFVAGVYLDGKLLASGEGRTKKEAEQAAAGKARRQVQQGGG